MLFEKPNVPQCAGLILFLCTSAIVFRESQPMEADSEWTSTAKTIDYYSQVADQARANCQIESMWMNAGYVETTDLSSNYPAAASALARKLARAVNMSGASLVVDTGFGFGDQDLLFVNEFAVERIIGLNLTPLNVEVARKRIADAGISDRVHLHVADALDVDQFTAPGTADVMVALENAMYYQPRVNFFKKAWRTLKPNGILGMTDFCFRDRAHYQAFFAFRETAYPLYKEGLQIPFDNLLLCDAYKQTLYNAGFREVIFTNITENANAFDRIRYGVADAFDGSFRKALGVVPPMYEHLVKASTNFLEGDYMIMVAVK